MPTKTQVKFESLSRLDLWAIATNFRGGFSLEEIHKAQRAYIAEYCDKMYNPKRREYYEKNGVNFEKLDIALQKSERCEEQYTEPEIEQINNFFWLLMEE
jgi:hypothetical protein